MLPPEQNPPIINQAVAEIEHALKIISRIVVLHGDKYLPIFERLRHELQKAQEAEQTKSLALKLAREYSGLE